MGGALSSREVASWLSLTAGFLGGHCALLAPRPRNLILYAVPPRKVQGCKITLEHHMPSDWPRPPQPRPFRRGWPYQGYCSAELQRAHSKWFKSVLLPSECQAIRTFFVLKIEGQASPSFSNRCYALALRNAARSSRAVGPAEEASMSPCPLLASFRHLAQT